MLIRLTNVLDVLQSCVNNAIKMILQNVLDVNKEQLWMILEFVIHAQSDVYFAIPNKRKKIWEILCLNNQDYCKHLTIVVCLKEMDLEMSMVVKTSIKTMIILEEILVLIEEYLEENPLDQQWVVQDANKDLF